MRTSAAHDLTGLQFGLLTVRRQEGKDKYGIKIWLCDCYCGQKDIPVRRNMLVMGKTTSCGCLRKQLLCKLDDRPPVIVKAPEVTLWTVWR